MKTYEYQGRQRSLKQISLMGGSFAPHTLEFNPHAGEATSYNVEEELDRIGFARKVERNEL